MLTRLKWLLLTSLLNVNADKGLLKRKGDARPIVLKMDPDQVAETFKSMLYSPYFKDMANQIAAKAVEHYISDVIHKDPSSMNEQTRDYVAKQRPKYFAQHAPQQMQQQQLKQQQVKQQQLKQQQLKQQQLKQQQLKQQQLKQQQLKQQQLKQQQLKQQQLQRQQPQQQDVEKSYNDVIIDHNEKNNIPAATDMILTDREPQSHISKLKDLEPKQSVLNEQVAYALLRDPSPDGDLGLGLDSLEQPTSPKLPRPPKKINGMYFRKRRRRIFSK